MTKECVMDARNGQETKFKVSVIDIITVAWNIKNSLKLQGF